MKLEYVLTQEEIKKFYKKIKSEEMNYVKKPTRFLYRIATDIERINSIKNEKKIETIAKVGDWILTGVKEELSVVSKKQIFEKYTILNETTIESKPFRIKAKEFIGKKIEFMSSWGEIMILESKDFLIDNGDEFYMMQNQIFKELYVRN